MRTLRKEPGKPWEIVEVPNELEALQKAVGGHLERVTFASDICVLCDKEALCKGLPPQHRHLRHRRVLWNGPDRGNGKRRVCEPVGAAGGGPVGDGGAAAG